MNSLLEQGCERASARLQAKLSAQRELDRAELIAVGEMMLNPKKLAFARWLVLNKKVTDYA